MTATPSHEDILQGFPDASVNAIEPQTPTRTRNALLNFAGEPDGAVREVSLNHVPNRGGPHLVVGPMDGRPLIVRITAGHRDLRVLSGNVFIFASDDQGTAVSIASGATVTVFAAPDCPVATVTADGGTLDLHTAPGATGTQQVAAGAAFTLHGEPGQIRITRSTK